MKKITAIFISVIIIVSCVFPIYVNADEIPWSFEYYELAEADFDKLIEDPSTDDINEICNETNKIVKTPDNYAMTVCFNWGLSKEHLEYLSNNVFMRDYLISLTDSEIYDFKFITTCLNSCYKMPFIIWANTSNGIRFVTFEPAWENMTKNFIDYYHAELYTVEEFENQFRARNGKVYYNGIELTSSRAIMRNKSAMVNLRDIMEAADIQVIDCDDGSITLKPLDIGDARNNGINISIEYYKENHYYLDQMKITGLWGEKTDISVDFATFSSGIVCYCNENGEIFVSDIQLINFFRLLSYVGSFYNFEVNVSQEDNAVYIKNMEDISVYLNGSELVLDKKALRENEQTIVPMRDICEALKTVVGWDGSAATIEKDGTTLALTIGSDVMYKNGEEIKLGVPVSIKYAGNVFVPLRPIVEAFDCDVQWNEDLQRVDITTK